MRARGRGTPRAGLPSAGGASSSLRPAGGGPASPSRPSDRRRASRQGSAAPCPHRRRRLAAHLRIYFPDPDDDAGDAADARGKQARPRPRFASADSGDGGMLRDRDLDFFPFLDVSVVCDACNVLLLLRAAGTPRFYVVDPVTRRWAALPTTSRDPRLSMLAFDPSSSSGTGGYHVVNFTGRWRDRGGEVEVYSSETRAWVLRDAEFGVPAASLSGSVHFHAGAVYVLASDPDCVVRMDVTDAGIAECAVAELPEPADGGVDGCLAHSAGRLHYVATDAALRRLKVWVLDGEAPALRWRLGGGFFVPGQHGW